MLDHLRRQVCAALVEVHQVMLASCGPAELQASLVPCAARDLCLYLLVPRASDHLYNLEADSHVVIATPAWEVRGQARLLPAHGWPAGLALASFPETAWSELVLVEPGRFHRYAVDDRPAETIDID